MGFAHQFLARFGIAAFGKTAAYTPPMVIIGDSIAATNCPAAGFGQSWPDYVMAHAAFKDKVVIHSLAIASDTLALQVASEVALFSTLKTFPNTGILVIAAGHNDVNAGASLATLQGYVVSLAEIAADADWRVVLVTPPSVGGLVDPKLSIRNAFQAWELSAPAAVPNLAAVVDLTAVVEGDTIDGTHPTAGANQAKIAPAFVAAVSPLVSSLNNEYSMGQRWCGTSRFVSNSLYEPAIDLDFVSGVEGRKSDPDSPYSTLLRVRGQNWRGVAAVTERGVFVGDDSQTVAMLASPIVLAADFTVFLFHREAGRAAMSGSNAAPILTSEAGDSIGLAGGTGKISIFKSSGGANFNFPELPACSESERVMQGQQVSIVRRNGTTVRAYHGNRRSGPQTIAGSFTFDRLFGRASGSFFSGDVFGIIVKEGALSDAQIDEIIHNRCGELSKGVDTALWLDFSGGGYQAQDRSENRRHALFPVSGSWHRLFPSRDSLVRGPVNFAAPGDLRFLGQVISGNDDVVESLLISSSAVANVQIGTASGGAQIAASQPLVVGLNKIALTANPVSSSGSLWIGCDAIANLAVVAAFRRGDI